MTTLRKTGNTLDGEPSLLHGLHRSVVRGRRRASCVSRFLEVANFGKYGEVRCFTKTSDTHYLDTCSRRRETTVNDPDETVIQVSGVPLGERVTVEALERLRELANGGCGDA